MVCIIRYQLTPEGVAGRKSFFFSCMSGCNKGFGHKCPYYSISAFGIQVMLRKPHCIPFPSSPTTLFRTKTTILLSIVSVSVSLIKPANTDIYRFRILLHVFSAVHHFLSTNGQTTSLVQIYGHGHQEKRPGKKQQMRSVFYIWTRFFCKVGICNYRIVPIG